MSGLLVAQILGPNEAVVSNTCLYTAPTTDTYGVRACFVADDLIDPSSVEYVGMILAR